MNNLVKTTDELIRELQELKHENNLLKELYTKENAEYKHAEKALKDSEEKYRTMVQYSSDPIFSFNPDETYRFVNEYFAKTVGMLPVDIIGKTPHLIFSHDEAERRLDLVRKVFKSGESAEIEVKIITQAGKEMYFITLADPVKDEQNKILWVTCISKNITERKIAEQALKESEEHLKLLIKGTLDYYFKLKVQNDGSTILEFISENYKLLTGKQLSEVQTNESWKDIIHPNDLDSLFMSFTTIIQTGKNVKLECRSVVNKETRYLKINAVPIISNKDGKVTHILGAVKDVTMRFQADQLRKENEELLLTKEKAELSEKITKEFSLELIASKEKAEESDRLKSAFLANMSHEIRTPMNGILGFAGLLKDPKLTGEEQQDYIRVIEKSGDRMLNIINDIVSISKIESGTMETHISETNINKQSEHIYSLLKLEAEYKKLSITFNKGLPDEESIINTDCGKFISILSNLVKNAIKYTDQGSIEFGYGLKTKSMPGEHFYLEFYIKDTGIGIAKDRQEAVFERFIQADIADKMARQGAGLGLAISKAYVAILGGSIWVESEVGKGSAFYFSIPYNVEQKQKLIIENDVPADMDIDVKKLKILIAEDDSISEMLISILVETFDKDTLKASTGAEAVVICRNNPDIDLILMDIQMTDLNGYDATRQIRQFNKDVIIIAQTAFGLYGDREKALEAGCNDYITKPINKHTLLVLINKYFKK